MANRKATIQAWEEFSAFVGVLRESYLNEEITLDEYREKRDIAYEEIMKKYGRVK